MSDLLNQASLVYIPSGYKEDTAYSVIPTDGSGDLTFTRASDGTRVNSAGYVENVPWNNISNSNTLNQYGTTRATITNNVTTAPNGTTTASSLMEQAIASYDHYAFNTTFIKVNGAQVYSVYAKQNGRRYVQLATVSNQGTYRPIFDLQDGVFVSNAGSNTGASASIESVGNGWYRCIVIHPANTTGLNQVTVILQDSATYQSYTGDVTKGVYVWGAQLNTGSTAKPYFPTTDRQNVPRLTYEGGCPSLLLEPQRTNLVKYSNDTSNLSFYNYQNSSVATATTSPDGTTNAYGIQADTASNTFHRWYQSIGALSGIYTTSIYVKNGTSKFFGVGINANGSTGNNNVVIFDLSNGTIASNPYSVTATITSVGNGWYRCTHTFDYGTGGTNADLCVHNVGVFSNYTATGFQVLDTPSVSTTLYVWGAQLEAGSYATSYIPTTSAAVTRVADAAYKTGISSLIGQSEGTIFVEANFLSSYDTNNLLLTLSNTASNMIYVNRSNGGLEAYITNGGTPQLNYAGSVLTAGTHKIALAYKANDFAVYLDGALVHSDTSGSVPACSKLNVGSYVNDGLPFNNGINQAALFKTRLTNTELAALTTL